MAEDYKARLVRFYEEYAPDKLSSVDELLVKSKGKEEKLFQKLVDKYGPEPEEEEDEPEESAPEPAVAVEEKREEDEYGSRGWWKARLMRFYAKYVPEKTSADVDVLLDKAKDNPNQLLKLFQMLEAKYGPEPEPSSEEEEEEDDEKDEEDAGQDAADDEQAEIPGLRTVAYCPIDGVPPEYSEYFDATFMQALPWLALNYPDMVLTTKKGMTVAEFAKEQGVAALDEGSKVSKSDKAKARKRGGTGKKGDNKIIIESVARRKKAITMIKGLETVEGIKLKDAAKMLGKKFASGCSVKTSNSGEDMLEIQGDWSYDLPQVLIDFFPQIKKDSVYTVDEDGKKSPAFD